MSNYSPDPESTTPLFKQRIMKHVWLAVLLLGVTTASWSQAPSPVIETAPDLDATLQSIERVQQQNPAESRPYVIAVLCRVGFLI